MIPHRNFQNASQHQQFCALQSGAVSPIRTSLLAAKAASAAATQIPDLSLMDRTPSKPRAALWMAGWLTLMLVVAVAGREATRELNVFQIMELRCIIGLL